jgi:hypothetical protein
MRFQSMRFHMKDVPLDPISMFDRSISEAAHRTRNRTCRDRSANFRDGLRSSFATCFQVTTIFRRTHSRAPGRSNRLSGGESCSRPAARF